MNLNNSFGTIPLDSIFDSNFRAKPDLWEYQENFISNEKNDLLYSGRLDSRNYDQKVWESFHCEIYWDKLVRKRGHSYECIWINCCYLKKVKYNDNQNNNFKYGVRLIREDQKAELFGENLDQFQKVYDFLRRNCLLTKFNKKYKIQTKVKNVQMYNLDIPSQILYRGQRIQDNVPFFIKFLDKQNLSDKQIKLILKEVAICRQLRNPFMINLEEIYEDEKNVYIIYQYFQGKAMLHSLREFSLFSEGFICEIIWKLVKLLQDLHSKEIFHRDLKLDNIFFHQNKFKNELVVSNIQHAEFYKQLPNNRFLVVGTPGYMAPEILSQKKYDLKVDIFSVGIIFYILIFGKTPWHASNHQELIEQNQNCVISFEQNYLQRKVSSSAIELMQKMLQKDPKIRPNASQIINSTWFIKERNKQDQNPLKTFMVQESLSTIQEKTSEIDAGSRFFGRGQTNQGFKLNIDEIEDQFDENQSDNSQIEANMIDFKFDSISKKISFLNSNAFIKVPSKQEHDKIYQIF